MKIGMFRIHQRSRRRWWCGEDLPSGGINLGPAMTFGFIAGRHAAGAMGARVLILNDRN
jgi:hypothetical protein